VRVCDNSAGGGGRGGRAGEGGPEREGRGRARRSGGVE